MAFGKKQAAAAEPGRLEVLRPENFNEFSEAKDKLQGLEVRAGELKQQIEDIEESLRNAGRANARTREAAEELLRTGKIPPAGVVVDPTMLQRLQRDLQVVNEAITLQKWEVDRVRVQVATQICQELSGPYRALAAAAADDLEAYGRKMRELQRVYGELSDAGTLRGDMIPNLVKAQLGALDDAQSNIARQIETLRTGREH